MEAEFSEKIIQKLDEYETYVAGCKSPFLHKEQAVIDRQMLADLIRELREFHSVQMFVDEEENTAEMTREKMLKNAAWQSKQMVDEAEVVRTNTLEEAVTEARREADRIMSEAKAFDARVKAEAEGIVEVTLQERRAELEAARKDLEDNREGILAAARAESEKLIADTKAEAEALKQQLDQELEAYRVKRDEEVKQQLMASQQEVQDMLDQKTRAAAEILVKTIHDSEDMVNLVHGLYNQQIEVIQQDRKEILGIIDKLERKGQGLQRRK